jgi:hypothetical protein
VIFRDRLKRLQPPAVARTVTHVSGTFFRPDIESLSPHQWHSNVGRFLRIFSHDCAKAPEI